MRKLRWAGLAVRNRARSRRQQRPPDKGFTLVEIVMTITITAIILVPTMDAVIATIRAGTNNTNFSDVNTVLQNAADRVNRAPKSCDYTQYAQAAAQTNGWSASTTAVLQQHYVPGATSTTPGSWAAAACVANTTTPPDLAVQMVTITVTSPDGKFQKTLQVVKSDV
jgi:prepilin-type N-terminal cleavage/methylation domain-containing protein